MLLLVAEGETHGYALIAALNELCVAPGPVDVGMAYRTLRGFESEGLVHSRWVAEDGAPRRTYQLAVGGQRALTEWVGVMRERARLTDAFLQRAERLDTRQGG